MWEKVIQIFTITEILLRHLDIQTSNASWVCWGGKTEIERAVHSHSGCTKWLGVEPRTFRSWVKRSSHWPIPAIRIFRLNEGGPPVELPSLWSTRVITGSLVMTRAEPKTKRAPAPLLTAVQGICTTPDNCPGHLHHFWQMSRAPVEYLHHSWQLSCHGDIKNYVYDLSLGSLCGQHSLSIFKDMIGPLAKLIVNTKLFLLLCHGNKKTMYFSSSASTDVNGITLRQINSNRL